MTLKRRIKITSGGQVSVPAEIRRRWGTSTVLAEDEGDRLVLRPAPDDPIDATFGGLAAEIAAGPALAEVRRDERELEGLDAERRTPR